MGLKNIFFMIFLCTATSLKYPYDPRIHNFGNIGIGGKIHAMLARPVTRLIDHVAYDGINVRDKIVNNLED